jgi:hypothetical protein
MPTHRLLSILLLAALLAACAAKAAPTPASTALPTEPPTLAPTPTVTATPTLAPTATATPLPAGITYLNPNKYQVEYQLAVQNSGFNVSRLLVYQPKPVEWDAQTDLTIDEVSPAASHESIDPVTGSAMVNWDLSGQPKVGETLPITIKFSFTASETHTDIDPAELRPYNTSDPLYKQYTAPERYIESNDPQIKAKAAELAAGETNPLLLARKFYDYIIDNTTYKLGGKGLQGAKFLLTNAKGECGDYSSFFIALSRASGIPARPVVGYWALSGLEQTHVWAEFYLEGYGWIPVDATIGQSQHNKRDFYFGNMDNRRVILNKGFNITLLPLTPDGYIAPFLQVPAWFYWGSGANNTLKLDRRSWTVKRLP